MQLRKRGLVLFIAVGLLLVALASWGFAVVRRGFSVRDEPSRAEAFIARKLRRASISPLELVAMRALNPKSPEELEEEATERKFLEGGEPPARSTPAQGHHH